MSRRNDTGNGSFTPMRIGFLINPIAGMGGRVGLKGTDGVVEEARRLGAVPVAPLRAAQTLGALQHELESGLPLPVIEWFTCSGDMGETILRDAGFSDIAIALKSSLIPSRSDTERATRAFLDADVELILFCGGDGTARDITQVTADRVPVLGIPSGVKMYSGVFGVSPARTAEIVARFLRGELTTASADILDLDEEEYRRGEWAVRLVGSAITVFEPNYTQSAKALISEVGDTEAKADIAQYLLEEITVHPETLYVLGPGSTVQMVAEHLGIDKTLLGIDALMGGKTAGRDLSEQDLVALLETNRNAELILSPIGAQGFVLGRGNLQISPTVLNKIGSEHITVVATPAKLKHTPLLRFDTGDPAFDEELGKRRYLSAITGYRRRRLVPVAA